MCKMHAFRHSCGHVSTRYLSYCRGTYAAPTSKVPLCHASPSLVVAQPEPCRTCQYTRFRAGWESKLAEAQARQIAARNLVSELQSDDEGCAEIDGYGSAESGVAGDIDVALQERFKADAQVNQLFEQYRREEWDVWRVVNMSEPASKRSLQRNRPSQPRTAGSTSLKNVVHVEDIEEETIELEDDVPELDAASDTVSESGSTSGSPTLGTTAMGGFDLNLSGGGNVLGKELEQSLEEMESMFPEY